jgi:hypothetical protein
MIEIAVKMVKLQQALGTGKHGSAPGRTAKPNT